ASVFLASNSFLYPSDVVTKVNARIILPWSVRATAGISAFAAAATKAGIEMVDCNTENCEGLGGGENSALSGASLGAPSITTVGSAVFEAELIASVATFKLLFFKPTDEMESGW